MLTCRPTSDRSIGRAVFSWGPVISRPAISSAIYLDTLWNLPLGLPFDYAIPYPYCYSSPPAACRPPPDRLAFPVPVQLPSGDTTKSAPILSFPSGGFPPSASVLPSGHSCAIHNPGWLALRLTRQISRRLRGLRHQAQSAATHIFFDQQEQSILTSLVSQHLANHCATNESCATP